MAAAEGRAGAVLLLAFHAFTAITADGGAQGQRTMTMNPMTMRMMRMMKMGTTGKSMTTNSMAIVDYGVQGVHSRMKSPRRTEQGLRKSYERDSLSCDALPYSDVDAPVHREECYGCGARIQTRDERMAGFVPEEKFEIKRVHKQRNQLLCSRCQELLHGKSVPSVRDLWAQPRTDKDATIETDYDRTEQRFLASPDELRLKLQTIKSKRSSVMVFIVDLLDASGSFLGRLRNIVGKNPVILIGTKTDLLPRNRPDDLGLMEWLNSTAIHKGLRPIAIQVVSSKSGYGIRDAARKILMERKKRDVYVIGAANVGKSAFVRALMKEMSDFSSRAFDPASLNQGRYLPVESTVPGTTLGIIALKAFETGGTLFDTPGVHLHHRIQHILTPEEVRELHPRRKLSPYVAESPSGGGVSYTWGSLLRLDVLNCPDGADIVFYGPKSLHVKRQSISSDNQVSSIDVDQLDGFGIESVRRRGGWRMSREFARFVEPGDVPCRTEDSLSLSLEEKNAVIDVAVSGVMGWASIYAKGNSYGQLKLQAYAPVGVEVYFRPPLAKRFPNIRFRTNSP